MKTADIFKRIKEPSTWAGIGLLVSFFGAPAGVIELVQQIAVGIAGLVAIIAPEMTQE